MQATDSSLASQPPLDVAKDFLRTGSDDTDSASSTARASLEGDDLSPEQLRLKLRRRHLLRVWSMSTVTLSVLLYSGISFYLTPPAQPFTHLAQTIYFWALVALPGLIVSLYTLVHGLLDTELFQSILRENEGAIGRAYLPVGFADASTSGCCVCILITEGFLWPDTFFDVRTDVIMVVYLYIQIKNFRRLVNQRSLISKRKD